MTALKCCCDLPAVTPSGLCWGCGHPREVVTSNLDLADKVRAVYNRCFLGRHELNVNDAAVLMEAVRFLHTHDQTPAPRTMVKSPRAIVDQVWIHLDDDSEENAQTGEVTISLNREQAAALYQLYWDAGGDYRESLRDCGWSPVKTPAERVLK